MPPTVIFGDIRGLDLKDLEPVLNKYGISHLDSAAVYQAGASETSLGEARMGERFTIDTKILSSRESDGTLTPEKIEESSKKSLERLGMNKVNILYTHAPDFATPIEQQAKAFNDVHEKGRFSELGLCNTLPDMVQEWLDNAKAKGYIKPTWFQGQYNLAVRNYEEVLFPLLRAEGIHFAAYSPLGGGFLNGNLRPDKTTGTRFISHAAAAMSRTFYDRPALHEYYDKILGLSEKANLSTGEVSLRWIVHHSALRDDDVLILGASRISQLEQSLDSIRKGPLDGKLAQELNSLWTPELQAATLDIVDWHPKK